MPVWHEKKNHSGIGKKATIWHLPLGGILKGSDFSHTKTIISGIRKIQTFGVYSTKKQIKSMEIYIEVLS